MQIYINNVQIETQLGDEENLAQVFEEVQKWVESQGKFLIRCLANGVECTKEELAQISIQPSTRMDFYVGENIDVLVSATLELDNYIDKVGTTLLGRDSLTEIEQRDLMDGLSWIREVLVSAAQFLKLDYTKIYPVPNGNNIAQIFSNLLELSNKLNSFSNIEAFLENLRDLKLFVMSLLARSAALTVDTSTLRDVIRAYSQNMEVLKNEFIRVNENLQAGKEIAAGEILNYATERLQVLLNALLALQAKNPNQIFSEIQIEGISLSEVVEDLKTLLLEIIHSFEKNDLVTAGDIIEYELPEVLEQLVPFLSYIYNLE